MKPHPILELPAGAVVDATRSPATGGLVILLTTLELPSSHFDFTASSPITYIT